MKTLQEHYNAIKSGKGGNKTQFLKHARQLFPEYINQYFDFDTATNVLKSKQIISEAAAGGVVSKGFDIFDWKKILAEEVKSIEKETSKEVTDKQSHSYDNKDMKNADNINFNEIMKGFYCELRNEKNAGKTGDELKDIVVKNLAKDPLYYTKNGEFGTEGVGYTDEAPGLGKPKEPKGKHKSSGYGDLDTDKKEEKVKSNVQDSLGDKEAKTSMPKKVKEMPVAPQNASGVKKMAMPGKEKKIKLKEGFEYSFSEYDFEIPDNMKEYIKTKIKTKFPDISDKSIDSYIENTENYYYSEARKENKRGREYPSVSADDIVDLIIAYIEDIELKEGIGMFHDPIGYKKPELSDIDKMFTKEYKGNGMYVIYKNDKEVKTIEGEGNANAWINNEKRKLKESLNENINKKYTHFAIRKSDGKIVEGWETVSDVESLKYYAKMDLKDIFPDSKLSEFVIVSKKGLEKKGIDPFDYKNWYWYKSGDSVNENEDVYQQLEDLQNELTKEKDPERKAELEKKIKALEAGLKENINVGESKLRSIIRNIIKEELK